MLDFDVEAERKLTFRLIGLDAEKFLAGYDLQNLQVAGVFDGHCRWCSIRKAGGLLAVRLYRGPGAVSSAILVNSPMKIWAHSPILLSRRCGRSAFAKCALVLMASLTVKSLPTCHLTGFSKEPSKAEFYYKTARQIPIKFNVRIEAEFLQLIGSIRGLYDADYALRQGKDLINQQNKPVPGEGQPASEKR